LRVLFDTNVGLHEAAVHAGAEAIVTRSVKDFTKAKLLVFSPLELLAALDT